MKNIILLAVAAISFASCCKSTIRGEGDTTSESRSISSFNAISANGESEIEVIASTTNRVIVTGYQNLIPIYKTKVTNGTLTLEFDDDYRSVRNNNIRVTVYTTGFSRLSLNGSGTATIGPDINTPELESEINGSGSIDIGMGNYDIIRNHVNGSGAINSRPAVARNAYVEISGSGDIDLTVTGYLSARISGSGTIDYWGDPSEVDTDISGSGKVRKN